MAVRILIVDDDEELCQEVAELLRENRYLVDNTSDPITGREFLVGSSYDIAIFDYKMPLLTGMDMARIAKKRSPGMKVFIISGRPFIEYTLEEEDEEHILDGVISKPFDADSLLGIIRADSRNGICPRRPAAEGSREVRYDG